MIAIRSNHKNDILTFDKVAELALKQAKAVIEALNKESEEQK